MWHLCRSNKSLTINLITNTALETCVVFSNTGIVTHFSNLEKYHCSLKQKLRFELCS